MNQIQKQEMQRSSKRNKKERKKERKRKFYIDENSYDVFILFFIK